MSITTNDLIRKAFVSFRAESRGIDDEAVAIIDAALDGDKEAAGTVLSMLGAARAADEDLGIFIARGGACVRDVNGGAWWPSDEIAPIPDSLALLAVCDIAPMLGTWHD